MSVSDPGSLSRANGAYLVADHFLRGCRLMKKCGFAGRVPEDAQAGDARALAGTPYTLHPQPSALTRQPSTLNPQHSTVIPNP